MNNDFSKTPSYYNSQEVFKKYLGQTSYYLGLQEKVLNVIKTTRPKQILELGYGTGQTAITVAKMNANAQIIAVDMRKEMDSVAKALARENNVTNVTFVTDNMTKFVTKSLATFDFIYLVYSFHHIEDPLKNKTEFLENCYQNMKKGAYLCIAETFIPEQYSMERDDDAIIKLFASRGEEGYVSTFWKSLKGLQIKDIEYSHEIASYCRQMEIDAGKLVDCRQDEYLVKRSWLTKQAKDIGFAAVLDMQTNNIGDALMLFQK